MSDNYFTELFNINVNEKTEKKNGLTYLSWAWAWGEFKKICPNATYEVIKFDGKPYFFDPETGYMVYTTVTVGNLTHEMWLPVMDGANKAMKAEPYVYTVKQYDKVERCYKEVEKTCNAATMFDINKTIMRCLVKNLAMFGLGLYIYAGEDLPEDESNKNMTEVKEAKITDKEKKILTNIVERKGLKIEEVFPKGLDLTAEQYLEASKRLSAMPDKR